MKSNNYEGRQLAFIIATKDRPHKLRNALTSLDAQTVRCGRVLVVDGGESVESVTMEFAGRIPVEYHRCDPPGQIRQRNLGISLLDERSPLVGFIDDDLVLDPRAVERMLAFWSHCEPETAGVSFNIINEPPTGSSRLGEFLGLTAPQPGRVLRSGMTTSNCQVEEDVGVQWLCGGATVWRQQILREVPHREIDARWAIGEDLVFSYPIGKKYPLYVCSGARVRHEHEADYVSRGRDRYHGRTQTLWTYSFVRENDDLSRGAFFFTLLLRMLGKAARGVVTRSAADIMFVLGQLEGAAVIAGAIVRKRDLTAAMADHNRPTAAGSAARARTASS